MSSTVGFPPDGETTDSIQDEVRAVPDLPIPVYDPPWLRRMHPRCLWDGVVCTGTEEFCGDACRERYERWEEATAHSVMGREPVHTFIEARS